ncbi:ABC transporter permease [Haliovirga abyssi]|uniref:ABC transporter substrate-binding protein n=1 Tax=Haliovirga abyssi TaxID=2996794 RepID=A0AAU9DFV1_9FUSO|nr:FtsX-like permease family protein [Haliovirga abyssi]BDU51098.1 ABC transporter substrate-binding protein [Haliovirga abyssi]
MFKIAFRNIFRNKKRSLLTAMSVVVGVAGIIVGLSWIDGTVNMMEEAGRRVTGDIRITSKDFDIKEKSLDVEASIEYRNIDKVMKNIKGIENSVPRIKFGGAMFFGDENIAGLGYGIEKKDYNIIGFDKFIYKGRFLDYSNENEIIIGKTIKDKLNLKIGDEVTLLTNTINKEMSALNYKVVGFYKMDNSKLNRSYYIRLKDAEYLLDMDGLATEYVIYLKNKKDILKKKLELKNKIVNKNLEIKGWNEIGFNRYTAGVFPIVKYVLALALAILSGVGIANTMLMVVFERKKEIGVLKALGMYRYKIFNMFVLEGVILTSIGAVLGIMLGGGISYYFSIKGIHLGNVVDRLSSDINVKSTIYMKPTLGTIYFAIVLSLIISVLATTIVTLYEVRKAPVENLR